MNQIVKDKMKREIMVVQNKKLFWEEKRESKFYLNSEVGFEKNILDNYEYMVRWDAEINLDYKQPIWYWVVLDEENRIFVYKRWWSQSNAWESRLHSKIAFWVWGHIEREDEDTINPISDSLIREIEEELNIKPENVISSEAIWYINDDRDEVWSVHIWVAYLVRISNNNFDLLDWELDNWEFVTLSTLEGMILSWNYDVESWSQILFEPIKNHLSA